MTDDFIHGMPDDHAPAFEAITRPEGPLTKVRAPNQRPPGFKARRAGPLGEELELLADEIACHVAEGVNRHSVKGEAATIWLAVSPESSWYRNLERFWTTEAPVGIQAIRSIVPMGTVLDALGTLAKPAAKRLASGLVNATSPAGQLLSEEEIAADFSFLIAEKLRALYAEVHRTESMKTIRVVGLGLHSQQTATNYVLYSAARIQTLQWRRRWLSGHHRNHVVGSFLLLTGSGEVVAGDQILRIENQPIATASNNVIEDGLKSVK